VNGRRRLAAAKRRTKAIPWETVKPTTPVATVAVKKCSTASTTEAFRERTASAPEGTEAVGGL